MIRLHLNSTIIESLNFNKEDETLEIEFKRGAKTIECMDIPISILKDYVNSIKPEDTLEANHSNLRIVYSNFKAS